MQSDAGLWSNVLYGDDNGAQRTIMRLGVTALPDVDGRRTTVGRYRNLDRDDPR